MYLNATARPAAAPARAKSRSRPVARAAHREAQRERHPGQRAHVRDRHARVGHRQEGERQQRRRHQPLAHSPEPPRRPVGRRHARRCRAAPRARAPRSRSPSGPCRTGRSRSRTAGRTRSRAARTSPAAARTPGTCRPRGSGSSRVEVLPEHLDRAAREMRALVDRVHERQAVVDVPERSARPATRISAEHEAVHGAHVSQPRRSPAGRGIVDRLRYGVFRMPEITATERDARHSEGHRARRPCARADQSRTPWSAP